MNISYLSLTGQLKLLVTLITFVSVTSDAVQSHTTIVKSVETMLRDKYVAASTTHATRNVQKTHIRYMDN